MKIKPGATLLGLVPQMVVALLAIQDEYAKRGTEVVITSGNDGSHSEKSKHYAGMALDVRTRTLPDPEISGPLIAKILTDNLGRDFYVLFEGDHIHVQYAPKRPV